VVLLAQLKRVPEKQGLVKIRVPFFPSPFGLKTENRGIETGN